MNQEELKGIRYRVREIVDQSQRIDAINMMLKCMWVDILKEEVSILASQFEQIPPIVRPATVMMDNLRHWSGDRSGSVISPNGIANSGDSRYFREVRSHNNGNRSYETTTKSPPIQIP